MVKAAGAPTGISQDFILLGYDAVSLDTGILMF